MDMMQERSELDWGETPELHWKKKKKKTTHCGSGCYWISVDGFPSPGEDDVVMNLECVCVSVCVCQKDQS